MKNKLITTILMIAIFSANSALAVTYSQKGQNLDKIRTNAAKNDAFSDNYQEANTKATVVGLSLVEKMFNGKSADLTGNVLKQVGYDLFSAPASSSASTTGKFDNNYKLSIGEKLSIYLYGDSVDIMAISGSSLLTPVINILSPSTIIDAPISFKYGTFWNLFS